MFWSGKQLPLLWMIPFVDDPCALLACAHLQWAIERYMLIMMMKTTRTSITIIIMVKAGEEARWWGWEVMMPALMLGGGEDGDGNYLHGKRWNGWSICDQTNHHHHHHNHTIIALLSTMDDCGWMCSCMFVLAHTCLLLLLSMSMLL